jgi:hypothetical protein
VVSTYIHLYPARVGLIRIGKDRLKRFKWSSNPWYLSRAGIRRHTAPVASRPRSLAFSTEALAD